MATSSSDSVDDLAKQLAGFHISARMQRIAEAEESAKQSAISISGDESDWETCSSEGGTDRSNIRPRAKKSTRLSKATARANASPALFKGLPSPRPGCRPCWEPPILDYRWFGEFIEAQKRFAQRQGNKDIAYRTEATDNYVEERLAGLQKLYAQTQIEHAEKDGDAHLASFWKTLADEVKEDQRDIWLASFEISGRLRDHWLDDHRAMISQIRKLMKDKSGLNAGIIDDPERNVLRKLGLKRKKKEVEETGYHDR